VAGSFIKLQCMKKKRINKSL